MGFNVDTTELTRTNIAGLLSKPFSPRAVLDKVGELITAGAKRAG